MFFIAVLEVLKLEDCCLTTRSIMKLSSVLNIDCPLVKLSIGKHTFVHKEERIFFTYVAQNVAHKTLLSPFSACPQCLNLQVGTGLNFDLWNVEV